MAGEDTATVVFAVFGLASQAVLVMYFAARRWRPRLAQRYGWMAYALAGVGLPLGVWMILDGQTWRLYTGPLLFGLWAAVGAAVDLWWRIEWRAPIRWSIFVPYVALYFWGQMFLWWPLRDVWRVGWACFLVLFAVNTALNIRGHFGHDSERR